MKLLFKNSFLKIKKSFGRFLSLLVIVALGVGFFAGLRETSPSMLKTADSYYKEYNLMDYKIISTMGLTNDDVLSLAEIDDVAIIEPSYSLDALVNGSVIRVHSLVKINTPKLIEGRMPVADDECLADRLNFNLDDIVVLEKEALDDDLKNNEFKVVGLVDSVLYVNEEKGITNIGNGKLSSFIFINIDNFLFDYYTEVYLIANKSKDAVSYSANYDKELKGLNDKLLQLKPIREMKRYEEILREAKSKIIEIEIELEEEVQKARLELAGAKKELDDGQKKLDDGYEEINQAKERLAKEKRENSSLIKNGWTQIEQGKLKYKQGLEQANIVEGELDSTIKELEDYLLMLPEDSDEYNVQLQMLGQLKYALENLSKLKIAKEEILESEKQLKNNESKFNAEILAAENKIAESEVELLEAEEELRDGYQEYEDGVNKLEKEIKDANEEIALAKSDLDKIEKPIWYLLDRTKNIGYSSFSDDALKVSAIAEIFPVFFIIIVYFMSLNTMTRMVEEERNEMGILASIGYSKFRIINSYLFYVLMATILGMFLGLFFGYNIIPRTIYSIYNSVYILPGLEIFIKVMPLLIIIITTLFLMLTVTLMASLKELKDYPSNLMRPKAPKIGKKVLLERITLVWHRLSFTWKVTIRNMFRYKKRVIMTVVGIAGSTALLLTGFGLKDGIGGIVDLQYNNIIKYDALFILDKETESLNDDISSLLMEKGIENYNLITQETYTFFTNNKDHDINLIVSANPQEINNYVQLKSILTDEQIIIPDYGVVITKKMAKLLDLEKGDNLEIRNSENELFVLYVSDIVENYTLHYLYMSPEYYEKAFEKDIKYNAIISNFDGDNKDELSEKLLASGEIVAVNYTSNNAKMFTDIIKNLNKIVYLIIGASSLLAFVVLYNLTTINITERIREIATLKVLGFYDREVSSYVYRETIILTMIGIFVGFFLGVVLHRFVMITAEVDNVLFLKEIKFLSYVYSFLLMILFTSAVQFFTNLKLLKINMIDSLKSVE